MAGRVPAILLSPFFRPTRNSGRPSDLAVVCRSPLVASARILCLPLVKRSKMQKLSKFVFISLGLGSLLAIAVLAQTSTPETSTPTTQPQATSPPQSPASPQQSPAPPPATQSSGSSSARPSSPQGGNGPSIDQELQLSDDQKQKIAAVVDDENRQI